MRPTYAEIDLSAIAYNIEQIKKKVTPAGIMAVVKANAYGHGVLEVARTALRSGASHLAVALVEEAIELRENGVAAPILVFGGAHPDQAPLFLENNLVATVYTRESALALSRAATTAGKDVLVHVKVDTGMGRVGVPWSAAVEFIRGVFAVDHVRVDGVYTHFATSDERDKSFAELQLARFKEMLNRLAEAGIKIPLKHTANSGAILDMPDAYFDLVRPGVMMYGYYPSPYTTESVAIRPAMTFKTRVVFVKEIARGTSVSYGRLFIAEDTTRVATLPVGYADGYNRLLTNTGEVLIRGKKYPVIGRVCMDQIMINLGRDTEVNVGDEAVLFGRQGAEEVSVYSLCEKLQTIPYEVTCWVSERVPRVYINSN